MSNANIARHTDVEVFFSGVDITKSLRQYLLSLTYTDNEEDSSDDLQIKIEDKDGVWLTKWLNQAIQSAASSDLRGDEESVGEPYKVIAQTGVNVRSRPNDIYYLYGTLPYGSIVVAKSFKNGWANIIFNSKNAYVEASCLTPCDEDTENPNDNVVKSLKIQAAIVRANWNNDGMDNVLDCGQFELDSVDCSGPPSVITIKGTSLPYCKSVRQTKKSKSWESYTLSEIAKEIAENGGMAFMYLSSINVYYPRVEQVATSDISFLQTLCHNAGKSLKISNNIIVIFDQAEYENKDEILTIHRGKNGGYSKWKLSTGEADTQYTSCHVSYTDPQTGEVIEATAYCNEYDSNSKENKCLEHYAKVTSIAEAQILAAKQLRLHNKYEYSATFTFPGDPSLLAGRTVKLLGWGCWSGKYIIKSAKHNVSKSGYTTQITLRRALEEH